MSAATAPEPRVRRPRPFGASLLRGGRRRNGQLRLAIALLAIVVLAAVLGPLLWGQDARHGVVADTLQAPSAAHPMGTDDTGRDILARFCAGAGISLLAGAAVVAMGALIGGAPACWPGCAAAGSTPC